MCIWGFSLVVILLASMCAPGLAWDQEDVFRRVAESQEVPWLEKIAGSTQESEKLGPHGGLGGYAKGLRTAAYSRLGELGTETSLAAIQRIEAAAKGAGRAPAANVRPATPRRSKRKIGDSHILAPPTFQMDVWYHPCWHFNDEIMPLGSAKTPDGKTYVVVCSCLLGGIDLFLTWSVTPGEKANWSRPALIPGAIRPSILAPCLEAQGNDLLVLSYLQTTPGPRYVLEPTWQLGTEVPAPGSQKWEIRIQDVLRDQDADGWTDLAERRLGLDPQLKDTDGDGLADGLDPCPNFAPPPGHDTNEEISILQKAVFATFGVSDSRHLLIVGPDSRKVQIWGYRGPVIYVENPYDWGKEFKSAPIIVSWSVTRDGDQAKVRIGDGVGLGVGIQYVHLRKIRNVWIVTKRELDSVS